MSTANSALMSDVAGLAHGFLRPLGFRKRRNAWNRDAEPGVIQCISFQMGEYVPPPSRDVPDDALWRSASANFTVNIGVLFEEITALYGWKSRRFHSEGHLSTRLGFLMPARCDVWWPLVGTPDDVLAEISEPLLDLAVPWLHRVSSRRYVLSSWPDVGPAGAPGELPTPGVAAIAVRAGDAVFARTILRKDLDDATVHESYRQNIPEFAARLGIEL